MKNLLIYVSFPFCMRRCFYCSYVEKIPLFNLLAPKRGNEYQDDYTKKVIQQIKKTSNLIIKQHNKVCSIHFGGGTPSLWQVKEIDKVLCAIEKKFKIERKDLEEVNIEIAPEYCDIKYIKDLYKIGFNRISFGVQSFNRNILKNIGRDFDVDKVFKLCSDALEIFDNVNIDLIFGLPGETVNSFRHTLKKLFSLKKLAHVLFSNLYRGFIMERVCFFNNLQFPKDEDIRKMKNILKTEMKKRNFKEYLHTNYHRNDKKCKSGIVHVGTEFVANFIGFGECAVSRLDGRLYKTKNIKGKLISKKLSPQETLFQVTVNTYKQFHSSRFNIKNWEKIYNQNFYDFINKKAPKLKAFYLNRDLRGYEEFRGREHYGVQNFPINFIRTSNNDEVLKIDKKKCLNCGFCKKHCPVGAILKNKKGEFYIDQLICNKCKGYFDFCACSLICEKGAISLKRDN